MGSRALAAGPVQVPTGQAQIAAPTQLSYTGREQTYVVPGGVTLLGVGVQGAWGGINGGVGQAGQGIEGYLRVTPGAKLYAEVGQNGSYAGRATFGGGGAAGTPPPENCVDLNHGGPCGGSLASSGGGATDVRTCSTRARRCQGAATSIASRLMVAAGGGGYGGGGNSFAPIGCELNTTAGQALNVQPLPAGGPEGPFPIVTSKGIVVPGFATANDRSVMTVNGATDAAMGTTKPGEGGVYAGCSAGGATRSESVAGSSGSGYHGGSGGNAGGLAPIDVDDCAAHPPNGCANAGAGGGGGGGYFGGGGGSTGLNACVTQSGPCNSAGSGEGGAAGSSFFARRVVYPLDSGLLGNTGQVFIKFVPTIQIDTPRNGAVYRPGQVVDAKWSCGFDPSIGMGISGNNCTGTTAPGARISTKPGTHRFTVGGRISYEYRSVLLSSTVTYVVKAHSKSGRR